MGTTADADHVRLSVPADPTMLDVVRAAARALCAHLGLVDDRAEEVRTAIGDAFLELAAGPDEVVLEAAVDDDLLAVELTSGDRSRSVEARRDRPSPSD